MAPLMGLLSPMGFLGMYFAGVKLFYPPYFRFDPNSIKKRGAERFLRGENLISDL